MRSQLATLQVRLGEKKDGKEPVHKDVKDAAEALDKKVVAAEETLFQMRVTGRGQDVLRWPMKTAEQLIYLLGRVADTDFAPTAAQREVQQILHEEGAKSRKALEDVFATLGQLARSPVAPGHSAARRSAVGARAKTVLGGGDCETTRFGL